MPQPKEPPKARRVFAGNAQGKRVCGYKLVGYETIEKAGQKIQKEIRNPVFEGEGKYQSVSLPEYFLKEFRMAPEQVPPGLVMLMIVEPEKP